MLGIRSFKPGDLCLMFTIIATTTLAMLTATPKATGCGGTPPPLFCGKTYVFAPAGNLTVVANQARTLEIETYHFLNLISFGPGVDPCPLGPYTVEISATEVTTTASALPTQNFGPFTITEGHQTIPVNLDVLGVPPGLQEILWESTVTFSNGDVIQQTANQTLLIVEPAPTNPILPRLGVQVLSDMVQFAHPGGQREFTLRLINNDLKETFNGAIRVESSNVSSLPTVLAGLNNTSEGAFAISDPGNGDAPPDQFTDDPDFDGCVDLPADPHLATPSFIERSVTVAPCSEVDVTFASRHWPMCADGTCAEKNIIVEGQWVPSSTGTGGTAGGGIAAAYLARFFFAADDDEAPAIVNCLNGPANHVAVARPAFIGPDSIVGYNGNTPSSNSYSLFFAPNKAGMQMTTNKMTTTGSNFSQLVQIDGQHARYNAEFSFLNPAPGPNDVITFTTPIDVLPETFSGATSGAGGVAGAMAAFEVEIQNIELIEGAPNGFADVAPILSGEVLLRGQVGQGDVAVTFMHQLSAIGVIPPSFDPVPMTNLGVEIILDTANDRYTITSTWTATDAPAVDLIGFDVFNDFRVIGRDSQPGDLNGDLTVDQQDLGILLAAFNLTDGGDLNNDGVTDQQDLGILLANFGM